ncbi:hypothetical protein IIA16_06895, partial [bacterium]|nr:hypothetical protein [bacterium]
MLAASLLAWIVVSGTGVLEIGPDGSGTARADEGTLVVVEAEGITLRAPLILLSGEEISAPDGVEGELPDGTAFTAARLTGTVEAWVLWDAVVTRPGGERLQAAKVVGGGEEIRLSGHPLVMRMASGEARAAAAVLLGPEEVLLEPSPEFPVSWEGVFGRVECRGPVRAMGAEGSRRLSAPGACRLEGEMGVLEGRSFVIEADRLEVVGLRLRSPVHGSLQGGGRVTARRTATGWEVLAL